MKKLFMTSILTLTTHAWATPFTCQVMKDDGVKTRVPSHWQDKQDMIKAQLSGGKTLTISSASRSSFMVVQVLNLKGWPVASFSSENKIVAAFQTDDFVLDYQAACNF